MPPRRRADNRSSPLESSSFVDILNKPSDPSSLWTEQASDSLSGPAVPQTHRLCVYATKHNTHITLVQPPKPASQTISSGISSTSASAADQSKIIDVLLSVSTGNLGFRKGGRGSYDAAYQLTAYALRQMQEKGMAREVRQLEVVLRGFGAGREAVTKVLLGTEGKIIRNKITSIVDATRLKFGGTRSKKRRRL